MQMTASHQRLLELIDRHPPMRIETLARLAGEQPRRVLGMVRTLASAGLVRIRRERTENRLARIVENAAHQRLRHLDDMLDFQRSIHAS